MTQKKAVHFGAGNIGRGFIGEVLYQNGFSIDFIDVNETVINALRGRGAYTIAIAAERGQQVEVRNVNGINNQSRPEAVVEALVNAHLVTTAIGPSILPRIAELLARGIGARRKRGITAPLDIIACENMIGASVFLGDEIARYLDADDAVYMRQYIGFPNAAVDRIVPPQHHDDPLHVVVEEFREWVVDDTARKVPGIKLEGVIYVPDLLPYIERKLFTVNTGHAAAGYAGVFYGKTMLDEALADERVLSLMRRVLAETGALLQAKWGFEAARHEAYIAKIIARFQNPAIKDPLSHAARSPIRKLGFNERFIRPVRELKERALPYTALLEAIGLLFAYHDKDDEESVRLQALRRDKPPAAIIRELSGLLDEELLAELSRAVSA